MPRLKNHRKVAKGLARGLSGADALRQAGYAESTIDKKGYQIIKRPQTQSFLTDALERLGVTSEKIMQTLVDGLEAKVVVKSSEALTAKETEVPDLRTRMDAADRIADLYGSKPRAAEASKPAPPSLICNFFRVEAGQTSARKDVTPLRSSQPFNVTFTRDDDT